MCHHGEDLGSHHKLLLVMMMLMLWLCSLEVTQNHLHLLSCRLVLMQQPHLLLPNSPPLTGERSYVQDILTVLMKLQLVKMQVPIRLQMLMFKKTNLREEEVGKKKERKRRHLQMLQLPHNGKGVTATHTRRILQVLSSGMMMLPPRFLLIERAILIIPVGGGGDRMSQKTRQLKHQHHPSQENRHQVTMKLFLMALHPGEKAGLVVWEVVWIPNQKLKVVFQQAEGAQAG
ncbi:uncharacterized protein [Amphiura filiformis]|uniref:uncharacterized protein isoform X1 n=1 Tax=Amphiura filiformis TaxID=82378 RepID=UPI003B21F09C